MLLFIACNKLLTVKTFYFISSNPIFMQVITKNSVIGLYFSALVGEIL